MPQTFPAARTTSVRPPGDVRRGRRRAAAAGSLALALVGAGVAFPMGAVADPAPVPSDLRFDVGDTVNGVVPNGVCAVDVAVVGGAGGRSAAGADGVGSNGAGARISATFDVLPGTPFSGTVGGGGGMNVANVGGAGGANGGGPGGDAAAPPAGDHAGAGGGGFSVLHLGGTDDSDIAILAGGGGGSGGGHSTTDDGFGGDAGLPTGAGTGAFAGESGTDGRDDDGLTPGGGEGGQVDRPGIGGAHSDDTALDGADGDGRNGGEGGFDPNYDAGGGGGGGWFGGGGGASTAIQNQDNGINDVAGAGGGGGSSYVSAEAQDVTAEPHGRQTGTGPGADGFIELEWVLCDYDLAVTKSFEVSPEGVEPDLAPVGSTITWTVTVTNNGPEAMTRGDVVTLRDTLPGDSAGTITSITATGGSNDVLESGPVTCDAGSDDPMPAELVCSRPFALEGGAEDGERGLDVGETLTVVYTQPVTDADGTVLDNTASVTDRVTGDDDDSAGAEVTVVGPPSATDDEDLDNVLGESVAVTVLGNDTVTYGPAEVELVDPVTSAGVTELVVPGQGTWTVSGGAVVFVPEDDFLVDPDPVTYRLTDAHDLSDTATVTVTYLPEAADDSSLGHAIGAVVDVDVLANDRGDWDVASLRLLDGATPVTELVVPGEGTWTVSAGTVTFTPEDGFEVDPTPVGYQVTDTTGDTVTATVEVGYVPDATDDEDLRNTIGDVVTVDVLANDAGDLDPTTVVLVDGTDRVTTLVVDGEGTWTVDPATGAVTFAPEAGYAGNPTPVGYEVTDSTGDTSSATVTVTYLPVADDDVDTGNTIGEPVTVDVLPNDAGGLDPTTLRLVDPTTGALLTVLTVPGEGTWTVDTTDGTITFTPQDGFLGNPTPVDYEVLSTAGDPVRAEVVITYLPQASDDVDEDNEPGTPVTVDVVGNDLGVFDPTSVVLVDPASGDEVTTLVVDGEGTWTVDPETGAITFTPQDGFGGDPTPVTYRVTDLAGVTTEALVTITYLEPAAAPAPEADPEPEPEPEPSPEPSPEPEEPADDLAATGWQAGGIAALAVALLLLGGAGIAVARRHQAQ